MARRWSSFDQKVIKREFLAIPFEDLKSLFQAMKEYRLDSRIGYVVKNYGDGLMMIKASNRSQGRCLFFSVSEHAGTEVLTALLAYKKESEEAPKAVIDTARARMRKAQGM